LRTFALANPFGPLQAQLTVGPAHDAYELEADRVADRVMRMTDPPAARVLSAGPPPPALAATVQRLCPACAGDLRGRPFEEDEEPIRAKTEGASAQHLPDSAFASRVETLRGGGRPLPPSERAFFEPRFGRDFGGVRVHADATAAAAARAVGARAFTIGHDFFFGAGQYAPRTGAGRRLMAHELTHVVQQTDGRAAGTNVIQRQGVAGRALQAPRFAGNGVLEDVLDGKRSLQLGDSGTEVRLIQESLVAMGYPLPKSVSQVNPTQTDGIFGPETEAAVRRFQTDAKAVLIDGIVGQETMGLLDDNDVSRPGARPPAITGPVAAPVAPGDCDEHFAAAGVTFKLNNGVGKSVANAANIQVRPQGGFDTLEMRGRAPIAYQPQVTINAPNDAVAANFRVGFVQNLLTINRSATYSAGARISDVVPSTPMKDGFANNYDPIFISQPSPNEVVDFATAGQVINLQWPDVPSGAYYINLHNSPTCVGSGQPAQAMSTMQMLDTFRLWVVVEHRPSGCVQSLQHVDWQLNWQARVVFMAGRPTARTVSNVNTVTVPSGDGSPGFVQGGPVPSQVVIEQCR
jgi:peptidoglycan hydrolase-like protein with peptidoglycan-binding domain